MNPSKPKKRIAHPEFILQKQISQYLEIQYPDVLFLSDTVANLQLSAPQKARNKSIQKDNFNTPDLLILEPRGNYAGLFIELKTETPFRKDGKVKVQTVKQYKTVKGKQILIRTYNHLEEQQNSINDLIKKGYYACFSWGFDRTKQLIDWYMAKPPRKNVSQKTEENENTEVQS